MKSKTQAHAYIFWYCENHSFFVRYRGKYFISQELRWDSLHALNLRTKKWRQHFPLIQYIKLGLQTC